MKRSRVFFLLIVFITGCGESDFTAKQKSSQLDPSFLAKILASVGRRVSYRVSNNNDYPDFVANAHLGKAETSESAYCKLNRTDVTRFSNRYTRYVNQVFNSLKVEIPPSCQSFQGFGETVGEMGCDDPNGCGGETNKGPGEETKTPEEETKGPGEETKTPEEETKGPGEETKTPGESGTEDSGSGGPTVQFPGSECRISWDVPPGYTCYEFMPDYALYFCCPL